MSQSSLIFFFLLVGYIVFITLRGELPLYVALLKSSPSGTPAATPAVPGALGYILPPGLGGANVGPTVGGIPLF